MKKYLLTFSFLLALPLMANAFMLYDIDFEPPTYSNGQNIGTGDGQTIRNDITGFIGQVLLIHDGGSISYSAPEAYTSGVHRIRWNMGAPAGQSAATLITAQLASSESTIFSSRISMGHPQGQVITYGVGWDYDPGAPFNFDQSYLLEILVNLDANYYDFWLDGVQLSDHIEIASDSTLGFVSFSQNQYIGLQAAVDNFQWEVMSAIPEPGIISLLMLGLPSLCYFRRRFQSPKH